MKKTLVRFLITLGLLALYAGQTATSAHADGTNPVPPICPSGPGTC